MKNYKPILIEYSCLELAKMAGESARSIVYRFYDDGNSRDERRDSTSEEWETLQRVIYGALLAIRWRDDAAQTALDTAEYIGDLLLPGINGYDSIYLPIKKILRELDPENKEDTTC